MRAEKFEIVSRLRNDANLNYLYTGEQKGRGRPKVYDGKVDYKNLSLHHTTCVQDNGKERIYHMQAYSVAFKNNTQYRHCQNFNQTQQMATPNLL